MVNKIWNKQDKCRVWLMEMPDAEKPKRTKGFGDIDKMTVSLLRDKGIRITKSSSITPKGIFKVKNGEGVAGKLDSFKRKIAEKGLMPAGSRNLFFEMDYDFDEFRRVYDEVGGRQNNFPLYLSSKEEFEKYKENHDLWVFEDVNTGRPIGFMTRELIRTGTPGAQEYADDFGYKAKRDILYMDTFALDEGYKAKGLGKDISQITDAYYLKIFGEKCDFLLVTGDINTVNPQKLSRCNHEDRGFVSVAEIVVDTHKFETRYAEWNNRLKKNYAGCSDMLTPLIDSYRPVRD